MKCKNEQRVVEATRSGVWDSALRAHLEDCERCAQTELIASSLQKAARANADPTLPSAGHVWLRSQVMQREQAQQKAIRQPLLVVGVLGMVYCVLFVLWGATRLLPSVDQWLPSGNLVSVGAFLSAMVAVVGSYLLLTETRG
jgi:hypothetical protein